MRLTNELKAKINYKGEEIVFTLKRPTNEEMNKFLSSRWAAGQRGQVRDHSQEARCDLFDKLLIGISGLEDEKGAPLTTEHKAEIPANWKASVIFNLFEDMEIDIKN